MIKLSLFQRCEDSSVYTNQCMWYTRLTNWMIKLYDNLSSVQFSCSVVSDSLRPMDCMQHAGLPCPSPTPGVYSNSCPLSRWYHPTISSSVIPSSSCLQSFPASGSFPVSQFFASGGQSNGSFSFSISPSGGFQDWFLFGWTGWISLLSKWLSRVFSTVQKHQFFSTQLSFSPTLTSIMTTGKTIALTRWTFVGKVMSALSYAVLVGHNFSSKE